jgi:hypothetical protein
MDSNAIKSVIDLFEEVGKDRPKMSEVLKTLNLDAKTAWDAVISTAKATQMCYPEHAIHITNELFKLGVAMGYKYAITKRMEKEFNDE